MNITRPQAKSIPFLRVLIIVFLTILAILLCVKPLVLTVDSIYGFLALKGSVQTGHFNVLQDVSYADLRTIDLRFMSWWSPGQWLFPAMLTLPSGLPLGVSCIVLTIAATLLGLAGYQRLFRFFGFGPLTIAASLLLVLWSVDLYFNFFIYQGGEIFSFGAFPWFALFIAKRKKFNGWSCILTVIAIMICFVAKTTMLAFCGTVVLWKLWELRLLRRGAPWLILATAVAIIPCLWFIRKGLHPSFHFDSGVQADHFLVPFASPVGGMLSIQQVLGRVATFISFHHSSAAAITFRYLGELACIAGLVILLSSAARPVISRPYFRMLITMAITLPVFMMISYLGNTGVDYHSRHLKLLSFLLIPILVERSFLMHRFVRIAGFAIILLYATADIIYQSLSWPGHRAITPQYFYRDVDNSGIRDEVDPETYTTMLKWDKTLQQEGNGYLFIEGNADLAMGTRTQTIFNDNHGGFYTIPFWHAGPTIIAILTRATAAKDPSFLTFKFPDYQQGVLVDSTRRFLIYRLEAPIQP